jgi:superfamily II DNA or RNA helicase
MPKYRCSISPDSGDKVTSHTPYQACYYAHELTRLGTVGELDRLSTTLFDSKVDLNPHQVDAALFAIANPLQSGVILADEVGLGKTIEAGLVLCQKWAERSRRLVVVCPAHIRKQWQMELVEKFNLPSIVLDRKVWKTLRAEGQVNPFDCQKIVVISYGFAARMKDDLRSVPFDLVVLDEAHKLRNAYQPSRTGGQAIRWAFELRQKILLTATPLQNGLLELYGLGWLLGDHIFGDKSSFQTRYCNAGGDLDGLRTRLSQICKRTLRKDCAYINYTKRQAITQPFPQTVDEKTLHQDVMDFMAQEISFAFPQRQRQLIEMILFKTLASSPQALASTLRTMRNRLVAIRDGLRPATDDELLDSLAEGDDFDIDDLMEQLDGFDAETDTLSQPVQGRLVAAELAKIDSLISRAESISTDSKSKALLKGLEAAFARLATLGAKRKALIFTESRKTQAFLAAYLEANGYAGRVVTFNGSNNHPSAKQAYDRFMSRHAGSDKITGSKSVDVRSALIEEFKDHADILLATEAAAEGINLQFCSLVVNYDLPWNPQRIEQRIGRCHRYGQEFDVVVLNFLSQDNIADRRVHDLLEQKIGLFDGLFGASDGVLGAIEEGIDFEKRVIEILKRCRTDEAIEEAFNVLQRELETTITQKMTQARQQLFEHFDADVHERLKMRGQDAQLALDRVGERFWKLAHWGLAGVAKFDDASLGLDLPVPPAPTIPAGQYRLISTVRSESEYASTDAHLLRLSSPLGQWLLEKAKSQSMPVAAVRLDVSNHTRKISMLKPLIGQSGWLRLEKLTVDADSREEFLLLTAVTDGGVNLDQEQTQRLLDVPGSVVGPREMNGQTVSRLSADAERLASATLSRASEAGSGRFRQVQAQVNQWADDKITAAEQVLDGLRREIRAARRQADLAETVLAQQQAQDEISKLEAQRRQARRNIDDVEEKVEVERQGLLRQLQARCHQRQSRDTLFTIHFEAV